MNTIKMIFTITLSVILTACATQPNQQSKARKPEDTIRSLVVIASAQSINQSFLSYCRQTFPETEDAAARASTIHSLNNRAIYSKVDFMLEALAINYDKKKNTTDSKDKLDKKIQSAVDKRLNEDIKSKPESLQYLFCDDYFQNISSGKLDVKNKFPNEYKLTENLWNELTQKAKRHAREKNQSTSNM